MTDLQPLRSSYTLLTESLLNEWESQSRDDQAQWLILSPSDDFLGRWSVEGIWPNWFLDFEDVVGHYRTVSPTNLDLFLEQARDLEYHVAFTDPPEEMLEVIARLADPPPFELNSMLENTIHGLFPWQIEAFNKLVRDESLNAGLVIHDTGTGKTAFIAAAIKWHEEHGHPYSLALIVVKKNNKADMQAKLLKLGGISSIIVEGTPKKREHIYEKIQEEENPLVVITNYEKLRDDEEYFKHLVEDQRLLVFWDEMPTRLSNRTSRLYKATKDVLWRKHGYRKGEMNADPRPEWMRQWELTATPIENSPEGLYNCLRLIHPALLGSVDGFQSEYVAWRNPISHKPEKWRNLDRLEGRIEHITHRASKKDPEIAKMFPEIMEDQILIDWDPRDRAIYDTLTGKAMKVLEEENLFEDANILALIQILQMMCDAPSMIVESARNREIWNDAMEQEGTWESVQVSRGSELAVQLITTLKKAPTDEHHTKFEVLREILQEKHPNDKVLIFMTWADYGFAPITAKLDEWGITYVVYDGTEKQRLAAKDRFRTDPTVQAYLSSDRGSDSIDLPEAAVGVNYNLPWTWTRKRQRQGRNNRVDSTLATTWWYDLLMAGSVELRKAEIIATKRGYHEALFDGAALEDSMSSKLTREDLLYILSGK